MKNKKTRTLWLSFDRALAHDLLRQLAILGIALVLALGLSYFFLIASNAEWEQFCTDKDLNKWLLPLYLLIDSNALNNLYIAETGQKAVHGWMLFASSITFLFGAFIFNGVIIGIITNSIERRVKNHQDGRIHYLKSGHYIIMGYDDMVPSIITHIFDKEKDAYVLILSSAEAISIREKLCKSFDENLMKHIIINYGHRVSVEAYKDIHLESAEDIYIVGNHTKSAHDAINVECVDSIYRYLINPKIHLKPSRIICMFKDLDTYAAFKTSEIFFKIRWLGIEFIPYNFYTGWAKQVFVKRKYKDFDNPDIEPYKYPSVYGKGITPNDNKYVHLVFVGTTNFAVAFAMEAAHVLHFPNADKAKTRITFIDTNADKEKNIFITRYRHFFEVQSHYYWDLTETSETKSREVIPPTYFNNENGYTKNEDYDFLDVEFEFIKGDIFSKKVQNVICDWAKKHDKEQYLSIYLAQSDQRQNFALGMNMPDAVYDNGVPVFIRQDRSDNFITNLRNGVFATKMGKGDKFNYSFVVDGDLVRCTPKPRYSNIFPFGMNETAYCPDERSLKRAKLINYLYFTANYSSYKFQSLFVLDALSSDQIWAEVEQYWETLSVALKWSNLYCAYAIRIKLVTLRVLRGLDIEDTTHDFQSLSDYEIEQLAKVEHNRWNVEKLLMGFRKPHKDEDKYIHPEYAQMLAMNKQLFIHHDIRPFNKLDTIKDLDYEFSRYIPWIMRMTESN